MKRFILYVIAAIIEVSSSYALETGDVVYQFLDVPASSSVLALGGSNVSSTCGDVQLVHQNPSLLSYSKSNSISLTYLNYIEKSQFVNGAYSFQIDSLNWVGVGLTYLNYGSFDGYDEFDVEQGEFGAADMCLTLSYARRLSRNITAGLSLKPIYSYIDNYNSLGLSVDVGASFFLPERNFSAGVVAKNIGGQITAYDENKQSLPWDLQIGLTKKLQHAPFRFSLTYVKLNSWNFDYVKDDNLYKSSSSSVDAQYDADVSWGDMFFRHMVFGVELVPSNNFCLIVSYNHRRHQEFKMSDVRGANGFAFGTRFHVYKFDMGVSYSVYGSAGGAFGLTLATSVDSFKKN